MPKQHPPQTKAEFFRLLPEYRGYGQLQVLCGRLKIGYSTGKLWKAEGEAAQVPPPEAVGQDAHRQFLEQWPDLSELTDKDAASRLGVSLQTWQGWAAERREANDTLADTWAWLYLAIKSLDDYPPGSKARKRIKRQIKQYRWQIDHPIDNAILAF
jgi:hypothetical protein